MWIKAIIIQFCLGFLTPTWKVRFFHQFFSWILCLDLEAWKWGRHSTSKWKKSIDCFLWCALNKSSMIQWVEERERSIRGGILLWVPPRSIFLQTRFGFKESDEGSEEACCSEGPFYIDSHLLSCQPEWRGLYFLTQMRKTPKLQEFFRGHVLNRFQKLLSDMMN